MEDGQAYAAPHGAIPPAPETPVAPQNFISRLMGVYFSPGETFTEIGRAPSVLMPLLLLAVLGSLSNFIITNRIGYENIVRKQVEAQMQMMSSMNVPPEKLDEVKQQLEAQLKPEQLAKSKLWGMVTAAFVFPFLALVAAGIFKLFSLIMGAKNTFKGVLSATSFAYLAVGLLTVLVTAISVYLKNPEDIDMFNPISSNVGAILTMVGAGLPKFLTALLGWVDVFGIWRIILLAIGCAAVTTKMKAGVAALPHVLLYGLAALVLSAFAGFMS